MCVSQVGLFDGPVETGTMPIAESLLRFPTSAAITRLAEHFGLPYDPTMQDWPWEVADPTRLDEFLQAYADGDFTEDERFVLMEMILQCCEDLDDRLPSDPRWGRVLALLETHLELHASSVYYWADGDNFTIAADVRRLLGRHRDRLES